MTVRQSRVYTAQSLDSVNSIELTGPSSHYLTRVLRLPKGAPIILFNGDGRDYSGEICEIQRQSVLVRLVDSQVAATESALNITLVQAITRGERMDYSLQKATELGVVCIQPVLSSRVGVRLKEDRMAKRLVHWQGVVVSACEQSGRAVIPEVKKPLSMAQWLDVVDESLRLVLDPTADNKLSSISMTGNAVSLLVGPEGGLTAAEIEEVSLRGVKTVSLGPRILRTETAGPAAIAVLQAIAGDL
jgi:16S rRNA (uracil1498-N3)-methyltransferase